MALRVKRSRRIIRYHMHIISHFIKPLSFFFALADTGHRPGRKYLNETFLAIAKGHYTNFIYHPQESWTSVLLLRTIAKQKGTPEKSCFRYDLLTRLFSIFLSQPPHPHPPCLFKTLKCTRGSRSTIMKVIFQKLKAKKFCLKA
jgi:hypothetical protein